MASVLPERQSVNGRAALNQMFEDAYRSIEQVIAQRLMLWLETALTTLLGREPHERRAHVRHWVEQNGECAKCHSHESRRFSRNGSRPRTLHYLDFTLSLRLPRVVCVCGGSVRLDFGGILRPYQRLGDDVDEQAQRWGKLGLSVRQMQSELSHMHLGPLALSTLTDRLHRLKALNPTRDPEDVPPILSADAIWATQLRPNGHYKLDRKGRRRAIKGRVKRPIFIATRALRARASVGIWPDEDRCEILDWQLGENEKAEAWITFLGSLEEQGICGSNGLQLIIHDGGSGLCSALRMVHFDAEQQRCLFHKLQDIYNAIEAPDDLSAKQRRRYKKAVFKDFREIWEAKHYQTMLRRCLKVVRTHRLSQPKAVATLRRDFRHTVTYYHFEQLFPDWSRQHLRTTSRRERFNRTIRFRLKAANAYHSDAGLQAMTAQETHAFNHAQALN